MSNTTVIDYEDSDGKGTVTLVANPFGKGGKYYARFDHTTVNIDHLIARIQKKEVGTNAIMAKHFASLFKAEILEALARGEAVNVLDLGTLYIKANGTVAGNSPETAVLEGFQVKFTSSKLVNDAVAKIGVKKIVTADSGPVIGDMTDLYTGKAGNLFTAGKSVRIEGTRIRITGDDGGIYFAPADGTDDAGGDESQWIKVDDGKIYRNRSKLLEFFLPAGLSPGIPYRIVLRTNSTKGNTLKKSYSTAVSEAVTVA